MYVLNNIIVTGDHTLLDDELGVIKVKKHPNSIKYGEYYKPFVYCINTTTKRIIIDNIKFLDWDEVDDMDIVMLAPRNERSFTRKISFKRYSYIFRMRSPSKYIN